MASTKPGKVHGFVAPSSAYCVTPSRRCKRRIEASELLRSRATAAHRSELNARGSDEQCQGPRRSLNRSSGAPTLHGRSSSSGRYVTPSRACVTPSRRPKPPYRGAFVRVRSRATAAHRSELDARGSDKQCQGPRRLLKRSPQSRRRDARANEAWLVKPGGEVLSRRVGRFGLD